MRLADHKQLIATTGLAFAVALVVLMLVNRPLDAAPGDSMASDGAANTTAERVTALEDRVGEGDASARVYAALGTALLEQVRETEDSSLYARADTAFGEALERDAQNQEATVGLGNLALAKHDFPTALRYGRAAQRINPSSFAPFAVLVDAEIELGRYEAAQRTLQGMIDFKPTLASYARVSYFRELHGDFAGAVTAMRLAESATAGAGENRSYIQTLLGDLEFKRGRLGAAADYYRSALAGFPGYPAADAGLALVDSARGRSQAAIDRLEAVVDRSAAPGFVISLAEIELAAGQPAAAERHLEIARAEEAQHRASGEAADAEGALFEAEHGTPEIALRTAKEAYASAPSVRAADALSWALTRSGKPDEGLVFAERALRLGSRDQMFLYHAGIAAKEAGEPLLARTYLSRALANNPRFSALHAPRARAALDALK